MQIWALKKKETLFDHLPFLLPLIKGFRVAEDFTTRVKVQNLMRSHLLSLFPSVRIPFPDTFLLKTPVTGNSQSQSSPYTNQTALAVTSISGMILFKAYLPPFHRSSVKAGAFFQIHHCAIPSASLCPEHTVGSQELGFKVR